MKFPKRAFADETDAGAVFLVVYRQPVFTRDSSYLVLVQFAERKRIVRTQSNFILTHDVDEVVEHQRIVNQRVDPKTTKIVSG